MSQSKLIYPTNLTGQEVLASRREFCGRLDLNAPIYSQIFQPDLISQRTRIKPPFKSLVMDILELPNLFVNCFNKDAPPGLIEIRITL